MWYGKIIVQKRVRLQNMSYFLCCTYLWLIIVLSSEVNVVTVIFLANSGSLHYRHLVIMDSLLDPCTPDIFLEIDLITDLEPPISFPLVNDHLSYATATTF